MPRFIESVELRGTRLGRYTVLRHLASGGMADVLLARADGIQGFERHVVLKRIRPENARDERFMQMFLDEARVAAGLHHQNIVQVHDIGEADGELFFAMEYLHGHDARKLLSTVCKQNAHVPLGFACAIVSAVAAGLHYAHERRGPDKGPLNIVHRDITPSNVFIGYDGAVKVLDFGIAKARSRRSETRAGHVKGKVSYMSPEQCRGTQIDRRSDVYALGVLLYELATTTRLFKGDNDYLVMDAIVKGQVQSPSVRRPQLPPELCAIIMKALAVDPDDRYQTAEEVRLALDAFAIKSGLTTAASALSAYMRSLFGERPEPWLESAPAVNPSGAFEAGHTVHVAALAARPVARATTPPITTRETRTSVKMAWEAVRRSNKPTRAMWLAAPLAAVVAAGVAFAQTHSGERPGPVVVPAEQPAPLAEIREEPAVRMTLSEPAPPRESRAPLTKKRATKKAEDVVEAPPPAPAAAPPPAPAAAPEPQAPVEIVIPTLSPATVSAVASEHARQLARCEGAAQLRGDVSVSFQVDGAGRVVKSQLASTIGNPRVATCVLAAVSSWKFPSGSAKGVYTIAYQ